MFDSVGDGDEVYVGIRQCGIVIGGQFAGFVFGYRRVVLSFEGVVDEPFKRRSEFMLWYFAFDTVYHGTGTSDDSG